MFDSILNVVSTLLWVIAVLMVSQLLAITYVAFQQKKKREEEGK